MNLAAIQRPGIARLPGCLAGCLLLASTLLTPLVTAAAAAAVAEPIPAPDPGWPQFRGPRRDGVSDERGLLCTWPEGGPPPLWSVSHLGRGFSSPILSGGRLFITGDLEGELHLIAFDGHGREQWRATNGAAWSREYPGARASAVFGSGRVYHQNAHGRLAGFDANTGRELWAVPLLERFGGRNITWGLSECPIVDERAVYATAGGSRALVVALEPRLGGVLWQSEPLRDSEGDRDFEPPGYVSPILVRFAGKRLLIGCSRRHLFALDAETGQIQWTVRRATTYSVLAMTPVLAGDGVFLTAPHGLPGQFYRLLPPADPTGPVGVTDVWSTRLDTCQGGVLHVGGRLYGSHYSGRKGWTAIDAATGEVRYEDPTLVKGSAVYADERLYVLSEDGWVRLLEPGTDRFVEHGRFRLAQARNDAWAHPVVLDARLYLRYHDLLRCYDVRLQTR